jgi:hypothetical protein
VHERRRVFHIQPGLIGRPHVAARTLLSLVLAKRDLDICIADGED